jgi:hypothetical protein
VGGGTACWWGSGRGRGASAQHLTRRVITRVINVTFPGSFPQSGVWSVMHAFLKAPFTTQACTLHPARANTRLDDPGPAGPAGGCIWAPRCQGTALRFGGARLAAHHGSSLPITLLGLPAKPTAPSCCCPTGALAALDHVRHCSFRALGARGECSTYAAPAEQRDSEVPATAC